MTSGRKLTSAEAAEILRLVGLAHQDGGRLLTLREVAELAGVHRCTIYRVMRRATIRAGHRSAQRPKKTC